MTEGITANEAQAREEYLANLRYYLECAENAATALREDDLKGKIADLLEQADKGEAVNRMVLHRDEIAKLQISLTALSITSPARPPIERRIRFLNREIEREADRL